MMVWLFEDAFDSLLFNINSIESMIASSSPPSLTSNSESLPRKKRRFKIF